RCGTGVHRPCHVRRSSGDGRCAATIAAERAASYRFWWRRENGRNDVGHLVPLACLFVEPAAADSGETIEASSPFVLGFSPFAGNQTVMFEAVERWIEGALLDLEALCRHLLNAQEH